MNKPLYSEPWFWELAAGVFVICFCALVWVWRRL